MSNKEGKVPQPIQAVNFDAPGQSTAQQQKADKDSHSVQDPKSPWWHSQFNLMLSVFALIVIASIVFVLVVPKPDVEKLITTTNSSTSSTNEKAPWVDAQKTQARSESQNILSKLLNVRDDLENKKVELWADERYQIALGNAQQGDDFYKQQQYEQAVSSYQLALNDMKGLQELLPTIIENRLAEGEKAIEQGKSQFAQKIFADILQFSEQNQQAQINLDRANKLDQALVYIKSASEYQRVFQHSRKLSDLESAEQQYEQALGIDAKLRKAIDGLQRVQKSIIDKRFQIAMSQGFAAMSSANYPAAKIAFSEALKIKPGEKIAASSYQQSLASDQSSSLARLITDAKAFEKSENWQNALSNYQLVLQRDSNQVEAKLGQLRVSARNKLNIELLNSLSDGLSLSKTSVNQYAKRLLAEAKAIKYKGPKLQRQIQQLQTSLQQMKTPIKVQFTSDAITEVNLLKEGANKIQLGRFSKKNLSLKPGRYIATGLRVGFRDVRMELALSPNADSIRTFTIECNEPINDGQ